MLIKLFKYVQQDKPELTDIKKKYIFILEGHLENVLQDVQTKRKYEFKSPDI